MKQLKIYIVAVLFCFCSTLIAQNVEKTDYVQILIYGQSLSMGWEAPRAITTEAIDGNYMLGTSPLMRGSYSGSTTLNPLVATVWDNTGGEQPIVSCVNVFSELYRKKVNSKQKFIGMTGGEGGQTIEKLSKECTNGNLYQSSFVKMLDKTVQALKSEETVSCPAIVYMQGEYNCNEASWYKGQGLTPGSDGTIDKDEYKRLLLILKNNMQQDIMQKYGQSRKPLFFIYQTSGVYIKDIEMPIAMAQFEFAQENDDVVLLNPHYALPDYNGGHLSTNGYRWFGEMTGKILYDVLVDEKPYSPVYPKDISIDGKFVIIDFHVPNPPLVFDIKTNRRATAYGFSVNKGKSLILLKSIEVKDGTKVVIETSLDLTEGDVEISYASNKFQGTGNLCDSYSYESMYRYFDDSADAKKESYTPVDGDGNKLYGKPYPMQNWAVGFYRKLSNGSSLQDEKEGDKITVYPNPTSGIVNIQHPATYHLIQVVDNVGRVLLETENNQINLSAYPDGLYFIKIENSVFKIIKN